MASLVDRDWERLQECEYELRAAFHDVSLRFRRYVFAKEDERCAVASDLQKARERHEKAYQAWKEATR